MNRAALANKINQATRTNKKINKKIICITSYSTSRAYGEQGKPAMSASITELKFSNSMRGVLTIACSDYQQAASAVGATSP